MSQTVRVLQLSDLVLWTENPRDPINPKASDQDVVDVALRDKNSKWSLGKLAKEMGKHYDFSELPTVVFHDDKPVVYDGNRRVILGKIKNGLVKLGDSPEMLLPEIPTKIPCNVCSQEVALQNVWRKHSETGSWLPLERDIFLHKHMKEKKSLFLMLEETTGIITANPHLNQRFVKEEIFKEDTLNALGLSIVRGKLNSKNSTADTRSILSDLSNKISERVISTRNNRGKVLEILDPVSQKIIANNKNKAFKEVDIKEKKRSNAAVSGKRQTQRVRAKATQIFGGPLYLKMGDVSNLYRDIGDLYEFYLKNKTSLSQVFPGLIRMALRLLCETAAKDCGQDMAKYVSLRFQKAKENFDSDTKTTLSNQNVTDKSIVQLLHTGAHSYASAANLDQTLAVSVILGGMLSISHGQEI